MPHLTCGQHARVLDMLVIKLPSGALRGLTIRAEHGGGERAAALHELAPHGCAQAAGVLRHQRHRVAVLVQHGVLVGLLKAQEDGAPAGSP